MYSEGVNIKCQGFKPGVTFNTELKELSLTLLSLGPSHSQVFTNVEKDNDKYECRCTISPQTNLFSSKSTADSPSTAFEHCFCEMIIKLNKWRSSRDKNADYIFYNNQNLSTNNWRNLKGGTA